MRAAVALAVLALLAVAPAAAQEKSRFTVVRPQPAAAPLRGTQSAPAPARPVSPLAPTPPRDPDLGAPIGGAASVRWIAPTDASAAGPCRARCDKTYYACLSGDDDTQGCSSTWGQCRSRCERRKS